MDPEFINTHLYPCPKNSTVDILHVSIVVLVTWTYSSDYKAHLRSITKEPAAVWSTAATDGLLITEAVQVVIKGQLSPYTKDI